MNCASALYFPAFISTLSLSENIPSTRYLEEHQHLSYSYLSRQAGTTFHHPQTNTPTSTMTFSVSFHSSDSETMIHSAMPINLSLARWRWTRLFVVHLLRCSKPVFALPICRMRYKLCSLSLLSCTPLFALGVRPDTLPILHSFFCSVDSDRDRTVICLPVIHSPDGGWAGGNSHFFNLLPPPRRSCVVKIGAVQ